MTTSTNSFDRVRLAHTAFSQPASFWRSVECLDAANIDPRRIGFLTTPLGFAGLRHERNWSGARPDRVGRLLDRVQEWPGTFHIDHPVLATANLPFVAGDMDEHAGTDFPGRLPLSSVLARTILPVVERDLVALVVAPTDAAQQMLATRILLDNADMPVLTHELMLATQRGMPPTGIPHG